MEAVVVVRENGLDEVPRAVMAAAEVYPRILHPRRTVGPADLTGRWRVRARTFDAAARKTIHNNWKRERILVFPWLLLLPLLLPSSNESERILTPELPQNWTSLPNVRPEIVRPRNQDWCHPRKPMELRCPTPPMEEVVLLRLPIPMTDRHPMLATAMPKPVLPERAGGHLPTRGELLLLGIRLCPNDDDSVPAVEASSTRLLCDRTVVPSLLMTIIETCRRAMVDAEEVEGGVLVEGAVVGIVEDEEEEVVETMAEEDDTAMIAACPLPRHRRELEEDRNHPHDRSRSILIWHRHRRGRGDDTTTMEVRNHPREAVPMIGEKRVLPRWCNEPWSAPIRPSPQIHLRRVRRQPRLLRRHQKHLHHVRNPKRSLHLPPRPDHRLV